MKAGWTEVALGELAAPSKAMVDPRKLPERKFQLYSIPAFDVGCPESVVGAEVGSSKQRLVPGDVILSRIVPHIRRVWSVPTDAPGELIGSGEWIVFRSDRFDPRFLRHQLLSDRFHRSFMETVAGVGGSLLRARPALVYEIKVWLPPIEEQRRIAAALDATDALRAKRRQAIAKLDTLTQAIFIDMFGDPVSNPMGWKSTRTLGDAADAASGITVGRKAPDEALVEVPFLAVSNVQDGAISLKPRKLIRVSETELSRYALAAGDLLLTEGGDPDKLGRGAVWRGQVDPCIHQNHVFRVRVTDEGMTPEFLSQIVSSQRGKRYFLRMAKQTTGIASINMSQLRRFPILEPPRELQDAWLRRTDATNACSQDFRDSLAQLDDLFASLQQRAFRGEL